MLFSLLIFLPAFLKAEPLNNAKIILEEYRQNLLNDKLENILDSNYFMLPCGFRNLNLEQYKQKLLLLQKNIVINYISESKIEQLTEDENGEIFFKYDGKTTFKARFVEEENKYKITSEQQTFCPTEPFLSFLISDNSTSMNIATDAVTDLLKATMDQQLATVLNGKLEKINCENQKTEEISPGGTFISRNSFRDSIKRQQLKISNNKLNYSKNNSEFVLKMKNSETGRPIKVYFDVNLENRKFNLKLDEC